jgi:hypothetical protein
MKALAIALIVLSSFSTASAAPIWLERQAVPKAALIDPAFVENDPDSGVVPDHSVFAAFLDAYVDEGADGVNRVRYAAVTPQDRAALDNYVAALENVDVARLAPPEQLAFWINLYNAATVRLILDNPGVASIRDIKKAWDRPVATIGGRALSLNAIEHGVVRPVFQDARTHYALNCASIGCPNLARTPYSGATLDAALDVAARRFVNHPRGVSIINDRVSASKIYGWYREDFGADDMAVFDHLRHYAEGDLALALKGATKIVDYCYDWSLNAAE